MPRAGYACECEDRQCPAHLGENCKEIGKILLFRIDMDDASGTLFCERCAEDALESGLFRAKEED